MMKFVVIVFFAIAGQSAAFAAPVTASGPTAFALAAVLAQHSPQIAPFNKRVIARLFRGNTNFGFVPNTKISAPRILLFAPRATSISRCAAAS